MGLVQLMKLWHLVKLSKKLITYLWKHYIRDHGVLGFIWMIKHKLNNFGFLRVQKISYFLCSSLGNYNLSWNLKAWRNNIFSVWTLKTLIFVWVVEIYCSRKFSCLFKYILQKQRKKYLDSIKNSCRDFHWWTSGEESSYQCRRCRFDPWSGN